MKEARIIFPVNGALNAATVEAIHNITHAFGGATEFTGTGIWKHPNGMFVQENVRICDIAYEQNTENDLILFGIAKAFRDVTNEVEVYLRYGNGQVQMISEKADMMDNGRPNCWYSPDYAGIVDAINSLIDDGQTPGTRIGAFEFLFKRMKDGSKGNHNVNK